MFFHDGGRDSRETELGQDPALPPRWRLASSHESKREPPTPPTRKVTPPRRLARCRRRRRFFGAEGKYKEGGGVEGVQEEDSPPSSCSKDPRKPRERASVQSGLPCMRINLSPPRGERDGGGRNIDTRRKSGGQGRWLTPPHTPAYFLSGGRTRKIHLEREKNATRGETDHLPPLAQTK